MHRRSQACSLSMISTSGATQASDFGSMLMHSSGERTSSSSRRGIRPPASSRSPARASSPRSAGRPPPLTDTTPNTAPGTLPGRARATGRPSTVAEGLRDLLWAAGSGRPRPPLDGEPQRTPSLEVKPSNISLTPRRRPDLTYPPVPPASAPATPPITRRSHDDPRHRPTSIISRGGAAASLRRHLHGSVRSPRAPQARRSTRTSTASRWRLRRSCTCAAARCSPDPGERPAAGARADGGPRGGWRTGLVDPRAGRPRQSTTTSASRGSRERSSGRHLRRDAARRRRAHHVGRPRLRHAARPRERRRNRLTGTHAQARKPSPSRGAGASTGVTWPHPFDSPSSRVAGRVTPPGAAGAPTGPPR